MSPPIIWDEAVNIKSNKKFKELASEAYKKCIDNDYIFVGNIKQGIDVKKELKSK